MNQPSKTPRIPSNSAAKPKTKKKSRVELDQKACQRKRLKKRCGHAAGSRTQASNQKKKAAAEAKDPRIGSKVPVELVVETKAKAKPQPKPKSEVKPRLSPEEELAKLENDERLDALLDLLDGGDTLNEEEQAYVDQMLDHIDVLMDQLSIYLGDENEEKQEDILKLLKRGNPNDIF
ncbi:MAG: Der GTPase-activating protein YihI [Serratia symbiotica]|nr:Der GTPase-activating protein YihI [Serratia symbiotica]